MKYACLVYHEADKVARLSEAEQLAAILAECEAASLWKAELEQGGHHVYSAGLQSIRTAMTVRNRNGAVSVSDGPFAETKEFLGGFTIIEARDLTEAIQLASQFASGLVTVEVRPLLDANAQVTDPLDQKIAAALRQRLQQNSP
ncbi:MAG TPA: YciI family protein [Gemmataceae bacterium]|nr:YciI family protein [Gemmataceae bacterium]